MNYLSIFVNLVASNDRGIKYPLSECIDISKATGVTYNPGSWTEQFYFQPTTVEEGEKVTEWLDVMGFVYECNPIYYNTVR